METLARRRSMGVAGVLLLMASLLVATGLPAMATVQQNITQGADPPGNNGTVKIDGVEFDTHPDNQPHVGCVFQVDFYGYDEGDLQADVTFEVQPPTGPFVTILTDTVDIGEDPAGGGTDLDHQETYDLSALLAGYAPHPEQGWHVKLTVNAEGSIGADVKHKVFWVSGCIPPATNTTGGPTTTAAGPTTTAAGATTTAAGATTTAAGATTTAGGAITPTQPTANPAGVTVSGIQVSLPEAAQVSTQETLPFTGLSTPGMAALAAALAAGGAILLVASRGTEERNPVRSWN